MKTKWMQAARAASSRAEQAWDGERVAAGAVALTKRLRRRKAVRIGSSVTAAGLLAALVIFTGRSSSLPQDGLVLRSDQESQEHTDLLGDTLTSMHSNALVVDSSGAWRLAGDRAEIRSEGARDKRLVLDEKHFLITQRARFVVDHREGITVEVFEGVVWVQHGNERERLEPGVRWSSPTVDSDKLGAGALPDQGEQTQAGEQKSVSTRARAVGPRKRSAGESDAVDPDVPGIDVPALVPDVPAAPTDKLAHELELLQSKAQTPELAAPAFSLGRRLARVGRHGEAAQAFWLAHNADPDGALGDVARTRASQAEARIP